MHKPLPLLVRRQRPKFVALCGWPKTGKTTIADYLVDTFGAVLVDDGGGLREATMALHGLTRDDVYTQEGKARTRRVGGMEFSHRQLLGDLGNLLEGKYGETIIAEIAMARLLKDEPELPAPFYVFPSVRKTQGLTYRQAGGVVIEVLRPLVGPSPHDFDRYDPRLVDFQIHNFAAGADPETGLPLSMTDIPLPELLKRVHYLFHRVLGFAPVARPLVPVPADPVLAALEVA